MSKTDEIVAYFSVQIRQGKLNTLSKLPSIRHAADDFSVSKNTIVEAYDRLSAKGLIMAKRGSGYYVCDQQATLNNKPIAQPAHISAALDRISLLKAQLGRTDEVRVGDGRPPQSWMKDALPNKLSAGFFQRFDTDQSGYGNVNGYEALRKMIAQRHCMENIQIDSDQIITSFGANHALDLIIRRFLSPGDIVLLDDPGYYPLIAKLRLAQIEIIPIPRTATGPNTQQLELLALEHHPKMFFTQSRCHNPTGSSMDLPTAHKVLSTAAKYNFLVVDDDPFVDLPGLTGVRLAELDQFRSVIFVGTYSKLLSASFRVGYIAASPAISADLAQLKLLTTINSSRFSEMMIADMIKSRRYQKHLTKLARRVEEAQRTFQKRSKRMGLELLSNDSQGYYAYLQLPDTINDVELSQQAGDAGIFLAPGTLFHVNKTDAQPALRINVARANDARFFRFLEKFIAKH